MKSSAYYRNLVQILTDKNILLTEHQLDNINRYVQKRYEKLKEIKLKEELNS